jgi:GT2 family glycosyltransferase
MTVALTIINYNSLELISNLLKKIEAQKISNLEIWVVDNKSPDNFRDIVKKDFPKIHFVQSNENGGFAKGQNILLSQIKTDLALILNPDTNVPEKSIEKMVEFMGNNPDCAVSSCRIEGYDKKLHSNGGNFPFNLSLLTWLFNLESLPLIGRLLPNFHQVNPEYYQKKHQVDWVGGTFMVAKTKVLEEIGFFNESYFMYFEDVDLCYRLSQAGHKVMLNPEVVIYHKSGGTSIDPKFAQFKGEMQGLLIFYKENFNVFWGVIVRLLVILSTILRIFAFAFLGKISVAKTYFKTLTYV